MKLYTSTHRILYINWKRRERGRATEVNHKEDAMLFHIFAVVLPKIKGMFQR